MTVHELVQLLKQEKNQEAQVYIEVPDQDRGGAQTVMLPMFDVAGVQSGKEEETGEAVLVILGA